MICGIDEAGRGCIAGALVVAGVVLHSEIEGLKDSKKLTAKKREILADQIKKASDFHIAIFEADQIDDQGLSWCINTALKEIKSLIRADQYIFDGNTNFGVSGIDTLIKADQSVLEVSAASILAKTTKDSLLISAGKEFPQYQFHKHQGYATKLHIEKIKEHGLCKLHRKTFKLKVLEKTLFDS